MKESTKFNLLVIEQEGSADLAIRTIERQGLRPAIKRISTISDLVHIAHSQPWEIILCCCATPRDGLLDAIRLLVSKHVEASLIVISSTAGEELAVEAIRAGAAEYLLKTNLDRLPAVVTEELRAVEERRNQNQLKLEKKRLEDQFHHAQKMEAVGTLAGGIAHDFNNILGAILGFTELALKKIDRQLPAREDLYQVRASAFRARNLVKQILAFGRNGVIQFSNIRLQGVIEESVHLLRTALPPTIEIRTEVQHDAPPVRCDSAQMLQVLLNLGTNSLHAMLEQGGELVLRFEEREVVSDFATQVAGLRPGHYVCLSLRDTGHGIPHHLLERVFDPFFTTKTPGVGTGLGLWTVRQIVTSCGGAIRVESTPGKFCLFEIYLPVVADLAGQTEGPLAAPVGRRGKGQPILVADDEVALLELHRLTLQELGFHVETVSDGLRAFEAFERDPERFALLITDETMPGMTGTGLLEKVWKRRPDMPVILSTGLGTVSRVSGGTDNCRVLPKPYTLDALIGAVFQALDAVTPQKNISL